jgi:NADPH:quinone reductase-like Zn-dependent oxidoreductase
MRSVKSARLHAYRRAEAVRVEDVFLPEPKTGEVLISVYAAGMNPISAQLRQILKERYPEETITL